MIDESLFGVRSPRPVCLGTGLVALDLIIDDEDKKQPLVAGGSCANVLTILSFIGWDSFPLSYLGNESAAQAITADLREWGVKTKFVRGGNGSGTPIIIERLSKRGGTPTHWFEFKCPNCLASFPHYRPLPFDEVDSIVENLPHGNLFYFDRVSKAALTIASKLKDQGALVMFEPSRFRAGALFRRCIEISDIVKFSYEQLQMTKISQKVPLVVQTLGSEGLKYRLSSGSKPSQWKKLEGFHVDNLVDSAGAGDWCSAGLIHLLAQNGVANFERATHGEVETALEFGQALAAMNCSHIGARGLMYEVSKKEIVSRAIELCNGRLMHQPQSRALPPNARTMVQDFCPNCSRLTRLKRSSRERKLQVAS